MEYFLGAMAGGGLFAVGMWYAQRNHITELRNINAHLRAQIQHLTGAPADVPEQQRANGAVRIEHGGFRPAVQG